MRYTQINGLDNIRHQQMIWRYNGAKQLRPVDSLFTHGLEQGDECLVRYEPGSRWPWHIFSHLGAMTFLTQSEFEATFNILDASEAGL